MECSQIIYNLPACANNHRAEIVVVGVSLDVVGQAIDFGAFVFYDNIVHVLDRISIWCGSHVDDFGVAPLGARLLC